MSLIIRILLFTLFPSVSYAFHIPYTPQVTNYSVADYKAGNQNWSVSQGKNGWMYFGNNRGLLQYDGVRWKLFKLPNNVAVRSLYVAGDGRIYVGSFEEFGYFEADERHQLVYRSLKEKVTGYRFFNDEIWTINEYEGEIFFQSFASFFIYDGDRVRIGQSELRPFFFFSLDNRLYAQFQNGGFYCREKDSFVEIIPCTELNNDNVVGVLPYKNQLLLVTTKSGLFVYDGENVTPWEVNACRILKESLVNRVTMTRDSTYIIGTTSNGLVGMNMQGEKLWHINMKNHLVNNTILGLHMDAQNNLWAALDNGIAYIQTNSPIYTYEPKDAQIGMVYDMVINENEMYLATNQGIYLYTDGDPYPQLLPAADEHTWYIDYVDNQLIAGYNKGTLLINGRTCGRITGPSGGSTAIGKCIVHGKEILLQTSYTSLSVFLKDENGEWSFSHNIEGFSNPVGSFEVDPEGNIWVNHMYKGIYRITLDEALQRVKMAEYTGAIGERNPNSVVNVLKLRGRIVLTDGNMFYMYEDLSQKIVPYTLLNDGLPGMGDTYRIVSVNNDKFWFIRNTEYVLIHYEDGKFTPITRIPFSLFGNPIIEDKGNIYVDKDGTSYFCLNGGVARFDAEKLNDHYDPNFYFAGIKTYNRKNNLSHYLPCKEQKSASVLLDYLHNNLSFELSLSDFSGRSACVYYKMDNYDQEWTNASVDHAINYSNIPPGNYTFNAILKNVRDEQIASLTYRFKIKPPFFLSIPALIFYVLATGIILILAIKAYTAKEVKKKNSLIERQKNRQQQQLKEQERLIVQLQNEKLESELSYKSKELACATLSIIARNDFMLGLKKDIQSQQLRGNYSKKYFEKLIRLIDENITREDDWDIYQKNFDRVHEHFFRKLKERYTDLTPGDLRMCALLRLNMPTKDIARMLSLSVRGVEGARYRLRKKLNLPEGENLVDFMITFK